MAKITVQNTEINVVSINNEDYICLTDMIRAKDGDFFVTDWLRNRLTQANHTLFNMSDYPITYTERIAYNRNSAPTSLTRFGGTNGMVLDSLSYTYNGNQVQSILDVSSHNITNGLFEFVDGANQQTEYSYNNAGDLLYDANKGIASIKYDHLGHPIRVQFTNGNLIEYVYAADGRKLRERLTTAVSGLTVNLGSTLALTPATTLAVDSLDYADNLRIRNQQFSQVGIRPKVDYYYAGGFMSLTPSAVGYPITVIYDLSFHSFLRDHQGNVRVVADGSGNEEQLNDYYPYGGPYGDTSTNQGFQPYKYNGKELDRVHGLDWYDYGARRYDPAYCLFTQMDPLAEQYPHLSPYAYCAGNPVNYVDPDGKDYWSTNDREQIEAFLGTIHKGLSHFDFSGWQHATDAEITGKLTYNDITHKYYTSYSDVIDGQITVVGLSFDANIKPTTHNGIGYPGAFVYQPLIGFWQKLNYFLNGSTYNDGYFNWKVNEEGRIIGIAPLTGTPPIVSLAGKSGMLLKNAGKLGRKAKMGRPIGKMSGNRAVQQEQIDALCNKYGIQGTKRQELHRMIGHQGLGYHEIEELILDLFY